MKLRTSFFDKATFKKDIARFWPIWVLYTVLLLLIMLPTMSDTRWQVPAWRLNNSLEAWAIGNFLYAALVSQLLFGDLFSARMCYALHAMPATRTARFVSHVTSGLLFSFVPNLIATLLMMPSLAHQWPAGLLWLAVMTLQYLFFFSMGVLSAVCTGKRLAAVAVYGILNFFSLVIYWFLQMVIVPMMYGVELVVDPFLSFSPVAALVTANGYFKADATNVFEWTFMQEAMFSGWEESWSYLFILTAVGIALLAISWLLYRRRKLESAGAFIASRWLSPVFLTLYTLCAGAILPIFNSIFITGSDDYTIPLIIGLIAGFFTGKMLLDRTVQIFKKKTFIQFAVMVLAAGLVLWGVKADVFGIVSFVPETDDIEQVACNKSGSKYTLTRSVQFEAATAVHQWAVENQCDGSCKNQHYGLKLTYTLKNGSTVIRFYKICRTNENLEILTQLDLAFTSPDVLEPGYVPQVKEIASILCSIDGNKFTFLSAQDGFWAVTQLHKWIIQESCNYSCGAKHFPLELTYVLEDNTTVTRSYQLCDNAETQVLTGLITDSFSNDDELTIVSIEQTGHSSLCVTEYFYEDAENKYYFPYPDSSVTIVTYSNGSSEPIIPALEAGRATIADLDRFEIQYFVDPKGE